MAALAVVALGTPARAQPAGEVLGEREAVRRALERPALVRAWESEEAAARAEALRAEAWPNPSFDFLHERTNEDPDTVAESFLQVEQSLPISGQRGLQADAAERTADAVGEESRAARLDLAADVRRTFLAALRLQERVAVREQWLERLGEAADAVAMAVEAGERAPYERERLAQEIAESRATLDVERARLERIRAVLAGLVGLDPAEAAASLRLAGDVLPDAPPSVVGDPARPSVAALGARIDALELRREAAGRGWIPTPSVLAGYKHARIGGDGFPGFVLGVGLTLPLFDREQGERAEAEAALTATRRRRDILQQQVRAEVVGLSREAASLREAAVAYREEGRERSRSLLETARVSWEAGEITVLGYLDAWRAVVDVELRALELEAEARDRRIALDRALGRTGMEER
ncbi:MAG: TolC family protein [Myxococcota bacterium]